MLEMSDVQDTSLLAYRKVQPKLQTRRTQVYNLIVDASRNGMDMTNMEVARALHWSVNRVTPRVYELRHMGKVALNRRRRCGVTRELAMAWGTTK